MCVCVCVCVCVNVRVVQKVTTSNKRKENSDFCLNSFTR